MRGVDDEPEYEEKPLPENHPRFTNEDGRVDQQKYLKYLKSIEVDDSGSELTAGEEAMLGFVMARYREASMVEAHGLLPDNIPWNRQPWWKFDLWEAYWSGYNRGLNAERELNKVSVGEGASR